MSDWPFRGEGQRTQTVGMTTSGSTTPTELTEPGSTNTKSAYTQISPGLSFDAAGILVTVFATTNTNRTYLVDIALGAAGSEQVLINNLFCSVANTTNARYFYFPVAVPAWTRIAARYQVTGSVTSDIRVAVTGFAQGWFAAESYGRVITLGATAADSGGIQLVHPGVAHTKGAYSQIAASTSASISALLIALGNSDGDYSLTGQQCFMDIAVGSAGAEQVLLPNLYFKSTGFQFYPEIIGPLPAQIPANSRVAGRMQGGSTATDHVDIILYGLS